MHCNSARTKESCQMNKQRPHSLSPPGPHQINTRSSATANKPSPSSPTLKNWSRILLPHRFIAELPFLACLLQNNIKLANKVPFSFHFLVSCVAGKPINYVIWRASHGDLAAFSSNIYSSNLKSGFVSSCSRLI